MEPLIDILSTFIEKGKKSVIAKVTFCLLKSMHRQIIVWFNGMIYVCLFMRMFNTYCTMQI